MQYVTDTLKDVYDDLVNSNLKRIQSGDEIGAARVRKKAKLNAPHVLRLLSLPLIPSALPDLKLEGVTPRQPYIRA